MLLLSTVIPRPMNSTYSKHAAVCAKFYEMAIDRYSVDQFVLERSGVKAGDRALFVGAMLEIADGLLRHGVDVTVVDYSDAMVALGRKRLPGTRVEKADLRSLPYKNEFDVVFVVGRVFTHMISDEDLRSALGSCRAALRVPGKLFFDNYEDGKIESTTYFNGEIRLQDETTQICRRSNTVRLSSSPFVVQWEASYSGVLNNEPFQFCDSMEHRAWSRAEIRSFLDQTGFETLSQGDNFDETSFFTLAKAV